MEQAGFRSPIYSVVGLFPASRKRFSHSPSVPGVALDHERTLIVLQLEGLQQSLGSTLIAHLCRRN